MHVIGHLIFGLIIGIIAKLIMPGPKSGGIIATILLGIVGAWLGGMIGRALGWYAPGHPAGFFMALLRAILLLFLYHVAVYRGLLAATQPAFAEVKLARSAVGVGVPQTRRV